LRCPDNYLFQEGDAVGLKWAIEVSGRFFTILSSAEECGTLCHKTENCKAIEWSPSKKICVLIKTANSNGPKFEDYDFCSKENGGDKHTERTTESTTTLGSPTSPSPLPRDGRSRETCPDNYFFQEGDAVGSNWAIEVSGRFFNFLSSAEECGTLCQKTESCKAIEWSPSKKICVLIKTPNSNGPKFEDYDFCSKGNDGKKSTKQKQALTTSLDTLSSPSPLPRGGRSRETCHCSEIFVSSHNEVNGDQKDVLGFFRASTSSNLLDQVAFGSTIYENTTQLFLIGGKKQHWRVQNWKRESLIRNKSCKKACPNECITDWEIYKPDEYYVKVKDFRVECRDDSEVQHEGSGTKGE
jgi:hypothetical protein